MEAIATFNRSMGHKGNQSRWAAELSRLCGYTLSVEPIKHVQRWDTHSNEFTFRERGRHWRELHVLVKVDVWQSRDTCSLRIVSLVEAPWGPECSDSAMIEITDESEVKDPAILRHTAPFTSTIALRRDPERWLRDRAAAFVHEQIARMEADLAAVRAWVTDSGAVNVDAALQKLVRSSNREHVRAAGDWLDRVRKAGQRADVGLAG